MWREDAESVPCRGISATQLCVAFTQQNTVYTAIVALQTHNNRTVSVTKRTVRRVKHDILELDGGEFNVTSVES